MTDPVTCPHCREHLDIPADYRGRAVRCASCRNVFTVPAAAPVADAPPPRQTGNDRDSPAPRRIRDDDDDRPRRRSNGGVWVLLFATLVVVGVCVTGCVGTVWLVYNPKMHPFVSPEGRFRVEFPGDPNPTTEAGEKGRVTVTAHRQNQEQYTVKCYDVPVIVRFLPDDEALEKLGNAEVKDLGAETRREATTHDGHPALDLMATAGSGLLSKRVAIVRLVLVGNKVYVVSAQGPNMEPLTWWVRKYFTSFELTDPAAKARAKAKKAEAGDGPNPFDKGEKEADGKGE